MCIMFPRYHSSPKLDDIHMFYEEELGKTISTVIRNNSCGIDNIVADFFIDAKSFMVPYLVTIFNRIFDTGIYHEAWNKGVI